MPHFRALGVATRKAGASVMCASPSGACASRPEAGHERGLPGIAVAFSAARVLFTEDCDTRIVIGVLAGVGFRNEPNRAQNLAPTWDCA